MVYKGVWKFIGEEKEVVGGIGEARWEGVTGITLEEKREKDRVISNVKQLTLLEETLLR